LLEGSSVGLDSDGNWAKCNGSLELGWVVWSDLGVGLDTNLALGGLVLAGTVLGGVWVGSLELLLVLFEVVVSP